MPQNPGLYMPTPPAGHALDSSSSHSTSMRSAILLRLKQDVPLVCTVTYVSFPITDHGSIFDGVVCPPASNPEI